MQQASLEYKKWYNNIIGAMGGLEKLVTSGKRKPNRRPVSGIWGNIQNSDLGREDMVTNRTHEGCRLQEDHHEAGSHYCPIYLQVLIVLNILIIILNIGQNVY